MSKTKELIVDVRKRQQWPYTPLMISGTPVERVSSFKYLGVNISEDLTWTAHIQTQVKKARQRLYHLRQLRKFRVSPAILKTFYSGAIESVLTQCISVWYGNISNQDCKALQRVVSLAERISGSALPSLEDIYLKCCKRLSEGKGSMTLTAWIKLQYKRHENKNMKQTPKPTVTLSRNFEKNIRIMR